MNSPKNINSNSKVWINKLRPTIHRKMPNMQVVLVTNCNMFYSWQLLQKWIQNQWRGREVTKKEASGKKTDCVFFLVLSKGMEINNQRKSSVERWKEAHREYYRAQKRRLAARPEYKALRSSQRKVSDSCGGTYPTWHSPQRARPSSNVRRRRSYSTKPGRR